jgi:nicotinamide-nucleotide amidase
MFPDDILALAEEVLSKARAQGLKIATAESCTGGLVAGALTAIAGSSDVFERGFVTYSNAAKSELLGVAPDLVKAHGAVSREVAIAMAMGVLGHSSADLAVSVTGVAGPGGGSAQKPVGLVYFGATAAPADRNGQRLDLDFAGGSVAESRFGDLGRDRIREEAVRQALRLLLAQIEARRAQPPSAA